MGADLAEIPRYTGPIRQAGLEPGLPRWQLRARPKGGEDIAYGWQGQGSTVHLLTAGQGLPLAFLVTAANVAEVTVELKVVDWVRVPGPKGRPKQRPGRLAVDKSEDSAEFRQGLRRGGFNLPYLAENGPMAGASLGVPQRPTRPASIAGRWSGVTAGWTTGVGWSLGMTATPKAMLPFSPSPVLWLPYQGFWIRRFWGLVHRYTPLHNGLKQHTLEERAGFGGELCSNHK
jgi:hypothetical protein